MAETDISSGLQSALNFPLVDAIFGRRSRRFSRGASIPDGPLAFTSNKEPMPLNEEEQMLVLTAAAGNTGWNYLIMHNPLYAPHISNYACTAGGRTFSSAAGFHTSELFYTDDNGVYLLSTRNAPELTPHDQNGRTDLSELLKAHKNRVRKLADGRLNIPRREPYLNGHNYWCANIPGSTLIIPVADLAQHHLAGICFYLQNGYVMYDDIHNERIPGLDRFGNLVDLDNPLPLTFLEQLSYAECAAELAMSCYAGMLMLQAAGLGGWIFDGIDPYTVLGASGLPDAPGLGFEFVSSENWALPNPIGIPGVFEAFCPPNYENMRAAVDALADRKFGPGGPYHPETPGPWKHSPEVRSSAQVFSEEFRECAALMAQYVYDRFGKFPGTVPSVVLFMYLQAHHLDLDFYDHYFKPGAYLKTHAEHMKAWHPGQ